MEWKPVSTAPFDRDLESAVIDRDGPRFGVSSRPILGSWINTETKERIDVNPDGIGANGKESTNFVAALRENTA